MHTREAVTGLVAMAQTPACCWYELGSYFTLDSW